MKNKFPISQIFHYSEIENISQLSYSEFLASERPEEVVLAILSNFEKEPPERIVRLILHELKLLCADKAEFKYFVKQLKILSRIRQLDGITIKTIAGILKTDKMIANYHFERLLAQIVKISEEKKAKKILSSKKLETDIFTIHQAAN